MKRFAKETAATTNFYRNTGVFLPIVGLRLPAEAMKKNLRALAQ